MNLVAHCITNRLLQLLARFTEVKMRTAGFRVAKGFGRVWYAWKQLNEDFDK